MDSKEISLLISKLKEENKSNSAEEREFNEEWIRLLIVAMKNAVDKLK